MKSTKTHIASCLRLYFLLIEERINRQNEYYLNPTPSNASRLYGTRELLNQMHFIMNPWHKTHLWN